MAVDITHFLWLSDVQNPERMAKARANVIDYDAGAAQAKAGFPVRVRIARGDDVQSIYLTRAEALELHRGLRAHLIDLLPSEETNR